MIRDAGIHERGSVVLNTHKYHKISNVGLVLSDDNVADGLTKIGSFSCLNKVVETGFDRCPVQQGIFRKS